MLYRNVIKAEQPEPRALLVQALQRLAEHKKTADVSYHVWYEQLEAIFDSFRAVQHEVTDELRIGQHMMLLGNDKRYKTVIDRVSRKCYNLETAKIHFEREAITL